MTIGVVIPTELHKDGFEMFWLSYTFAFRGHKPPQQAIQGIISILVINNKRERRIECFSQDCNFSFYPTYFL